MKIIQNLKKYTNLALDILFPEDIKCLLCGRELDNDSMFCSHCLDLDIFNEGSRCIYCDSMVKDGNIVCTFCSENRHKFKKCVCPLNYNFLVRQAILKFKDDNAQYLARPFAKLVYERIKQENWQIDFIVPVPSYKKAIKKRGYNPALLLANELSSLMNVPVYQVLSKNVPSPNQKFMDYTSRYKNLQYTMRLESKDFIKDKNILIVDDVITTGATIDACANLFGKAKAIYGCGVARTNFIGREWSKEI